MAMIHFFDQTPETLADWCEQHELPRYAAKQIIEWVYHHGATKPEHMTNLSKQHRTLLAESMAFESATLLEHQIATDGTQKLLLGWDGPNTQSERQTECVMIPTEKRRTACISSQVGCPVGCTFCASGLGGLESNLTAGRIVEQVHWLGGIKASRDQGNKGVRESKALDHSRQRITNIVFMGMGEPLANYKAVTSAIRTLNAPWGFGISARKITVSTVGLPAAIRKLVDFEIPVTLALSLHAPNDDIRRKLIPWAEYATIEELLDACDEYFAKTGREITLEYLLLRGVNDQPDHARELASVAKRLRANVNLIRYNEVRGLPFDRPTTADVHEFQRILRHHHVNAHLRASRGRDIAAACGQLRHEKRTELRIDT